MIQLPAGSDDVCDACEHRRNQHNAHTLDQRCLEPSCRCQGWLSPPANEKPSPPLENVRLDADAIIAENDAGVDDVFVNELLWGIHQASKRLPQMACRYVRMQARMVDSMSGSFSKTMALGQFLEFVESWARAYEIDQEIAKRRAAKADATKTTDQGKIT